MNVYLAGSASTVTLALKDLNGTALVPTGLTYRIVDGDGDELVAATPLTVVPGDTEVSVSVSAITNTLAAGSAVEARTLHLTVVTASGTVALEDSWLIRASSLLNVPNTSFQTWAQVQAELLQMPTQLNFSGAARDQQEGALLEAYLRLSRFSYEVIEGYDSFEQITWPGEGKAYSIDPTDWIDMTMDDFLVYPPSFRQALRRAQIAEADDVLSAASPNDRRRLGLMSESIGESSMMFRTSKPVDLGASQNALRYLSRYIRRTKIIGRA